MKPQTADERSSWDRQRERSTPLMLRLLVASALWLGRPVIRIIMWPVAVYFWLTHPTARRASQVYLQRVSGRRPSAAAVLRHLYTFATVSVDRVYLLSGRKNTLEIETRMAPEVYELFTSERGCIVLVAHFGSFEALRIPTGIRRVWNVRILLDRKVGRMAIALLERLNPALAAGVIDAAHRGPELVIALKEALDSGHIIGIMADRARADERAVTVQFLGAAVRVPAGPWILAGTLGVPVVLGFCTYRGGRRYERQFELLSPRIELPRATREQALTEWAQRYFTLLEERVRSAPYNWFNFYGFWS